MRFKIFNTEDAEAKRIVNKLYDSEKGKSLRAPTKPIGREPTTKEREQADKRENRKTTWVLLKYDRLNNEYIWDEWENVRMKNVDPSSVHITGKRGHYLWTDLWDELKWAHDDQSAIHVYLWMINNKLDADALNERKGSDIDWKKILIYGAVGVVVLIVASGFIPH